MIPNIGTTMSVEVVTPLQAQQYLDDQAGNRQPRQGKIDQYARDMVSGRWHSSILRFDKEGHLVDGQHRLLAVVSADTAVPFYVERGISAEAVATIDAGLPRTLSDVLQMRGEFNAKTLAAAIRYAQIFDTIPGLTPSSSNRVPFSNEESLDYLKAHPELQDSVRLGKNLLKNLPFRSASIAAALHMLERRQNADMADLFWGQMTTGIGLVDNTGPMRLRQAVIQDKIARAEDRMSLNTLSAISIKAWNAWVAGREVKALRWLRGPQVAEAFPRLGE